MSVLTPTPAAPTPPPPAAPPRANVGLRVGAVITGLLIIVAALNLFQLTAGRDSVTSHYGFTTSAATLVLDADSADIRVRSGAAGRLTVDRDASTPHGHTLAPPRLAGTTLRLPSDCHGSGLGWFTFCSVTYTVYVPADLDLTVRTGSGDIDLTAVTLTALTVKAGSGDLTLNDVAAPATTATTGSGDVQLVGLVGRDTVVSTGSGDVDVDFAQDPASLKASTGSGDLMVVVPRDSTAYTVHQHTGSGDFTNHLLSVDQAPAGTVAPLLTVSTGSGDLTLAYAD